MTHRNYSESELGIVQHVIDSFAKVGEFLIGLHVVLFNHSIVTAAGLGSGPYNLRQGIHKTMPTSSR